ncbi:MBL fold metallo-hydrolase [Bacillus safensis]|uniref:MBL fold metallo-hydrolase n=1 Tax=Bacillus safensis TaxID=561879 RepID=UPI00163C784D|nr:MBL fold metallo-hydrolase [Bacillus safensis]MBU5206332.1 MBL fold metallo-hydrolase [Bacillus safensis]
MSEIIIEMFPADNGDSFLIRCKGERTSNILIDFGYEETYREFIKPRLLELSADGEKLDLVVLTHIDADHVEGAQFFFEENGNSSNPSIIEVKEVWHNSFRHLAISEGSQTIPDKLVRKVERKVKSFPTKKNQRDETKVSIEQGTRIASLLYKYEYSWNSLFDGRAVTFSTGPIALNEDVNLTVLSPTGSQLDRLREHWRTGLKKLFPGVPIVDDRILDDAVEFVSYLYPDWGVPNLSEKASSHKGLISLAENPFREEKSVINASSITFILDFYDKKVLFLADSQSSIIKNSLERLYENESFPIFFDAIKVSHHGSKANTSKELLDFIYSDKYLISTNGAQYGHPHLEALARLVVNDKKYDKKNIFFNYETESSSKFSKKQWEQEFNYSVITAETNKSLIIVI